MSTITKEQAKDLRNAFQCWQQDYDPVEDKEQYDMFGLGMVAMDTLLASLEAEAVGEVVLGEYDDCGCHPDARVVCIAADGQADWENFKDGTRLYAAPPSPVSVPDEDLLHMAASAIEDLLDHCDPNTDYYSGVWADVPDKLRLAAMLHGAGGNSTVIPDGWVACSERMPREVLASLQNIARLRRNLNDFCGDKSVIAKCLIEAEEALLNAVNRHSTMLSETQLEAKNV
ncbi:hypothetical protein BTK98_001576 [Enterobacter roggenkampii]|nr:hypothetical protein [Enterobacter roggenkampii]